MRFTDASAAPPLPHTQTPTPDVLLVLLPAHVQALRQKPSSRPRRAKQAILWAPSNPEKDRAELHELFVKYVKRRPTAEEAITGVSNWGRWQCSKVRVSARTRCCLPLALR